MRIPPEDVTSGISPIEGRDIVRIKLFDGMIRELKNVMYVLQLRKNLTSVGALKVQFLKMSNGRRNNLYYLKGIAVIENLTVAEHLKDDSTMLWQMFGSFRTFERRIYHVMENEAQTYRRKIFVSS